MSATIDFGIDLGTTNSSITLCRGGETRIFQNNDLMNVTPSVVYISKTGRMLVGKKAYDIWVQDPENTHAEFKRWMGYSDRLTFVASGKSMSAPELSAEVLKSLRADAMRQTQEEINAAVITVPAAFGTLQCDATGQAATWAGFEQTSLLQEPIAAAIAYGAGPSSKSQRWMVFDLGGGTLDIAIVSTRNGRLSVLEHQGDNRLGGKDIDRLIAEAFLLEPLGKTFSLPDRKEQPQAFSRLHRALVRQAEQAKIQLSSATQVSVDLFNLGEDRDGKPIELSVSLSREHVEAQIAPLLERCLALAKRALEGARLSSSDLDRVLLVGGPTQTPVLRAALESGLGAKLDFSLDPMTVVSQGAAFFASTVTKTAPSIKPAAQAKPAVGTVTVDLSYERASGAAQSPVAGIVPGSSGIQQIKIDAEGGFWTSGWAPVAQGRFMVEVMLNDRKPMTKFTLSARDGKGRAIAVTPAEFSITFMLPMAAPPLPHTIAVELSDAHGRPTYDPVFKRHCPLPAEARRTYKAERTLRPSEVNATLPIKLWEIELSDDPQERWWAGCVHIRAENIRRPIVEGTELELTLKIDASRKMTVDVFIPLLNESFSQGVYLPDPPTARSQLQQQLDLCFERLEAVRRQVYESDRDDLIDRVQGLQNRLEAIAEEFGADVAGDPDATLGPTDTLRKIRIQLSQLEEQLDVAADSSVTRGARNYLKWAGSWAHTHGSDAQRQEVTRLTAQFDKFVEADDARGIKWVEQQARILGTSVVEEIPSYWYDRLAYMERPGFRFLNQRQAAMLLSTAQSARQRNDLLTVRDSVRKLWALLPPDKVEAAKEQSASSGLRGT